MQVLKGKNKIIFFLFLFLFLTTYEFNQEKSFPLFKIKQVQFINHNHLEENFPCQLIGLHRMILAHKEMKQWCFRHKALLE